MLPSCEPPPPAPPAAESALLLTIDTWRADGLGAGGDPIVRTPWLDRMFRNSVQFAETFSPVPSTLPSHTSMLTGLWPTHHGVTRNLSQVPQDLVTLPEVLQESGFATAAFVSGAVLDASFGLDQGFDLYNFRATNPMELDQPWRPAVRTLHRALTWWNSTEGRRFLWAHVFEPHYPYEANPLLTEVYDPGYRGPANGSMEFIMGVWGEEDFVPADVSRHLTAMYRAEITAVDRIVGQFLARISKEGTVIVVTSDHGESLGEHNLYFRHGPNVFPADVQVPLAVRVPGWEPKVSETMVRTIDIPGTFLTLLGVDSETASGVDSDGDDLTTRIDGEDLPVFGVGAQPWEAMAKTGFPSATLQRVFRDREAAWVETPWADGAERLYDRKTDPGELSPVPPEDTARIARMRHQLDEWIGDVVDPADLLIDPELQRQLESLGYAE